MHKSDTQQDWLGPVLAQQLGRVTAPVRLWERVQMPRLQARKSVMRPITWALAAGAVVVVALWGLHLRGESKFAAEFHSQDGARLRTWVKSTTGLEIPVPDELPASVRACSVKGALPTVQITYRAGGRDVTLLISKAAEVAPGSGHQFLSGESSWILHGQLYRVATDQAHRAACGLCHSDRVS